MIRMRWMWMVGPALLVAAVGCGGNTPEAASPSGTADVAPAGTAPAEQQDDESIADLKSHHRHHHGGFAMFIAMSLNSLGTTPDENATITKIQADMRAKMLPAHDAEKNVLTLLADGVAAGSIDSAKVDAAIAQLSSASAGIHDAIADSLNQLHAALTPPQRAALVQKVEAHFHVWQQVNSEEEASGQQPHGHLERLAKDLGLSPDQVEKIKATLQSSAGSHGHYDKAEGESHLKAFGDAFASDSFDAKTLTTAGSANAHIATWGATHAARFYEAVTPVLTPDQRTKLADMLRKHANYTPNQPGT